MTTASRGGGVLQDQNLNVHYNEASVGWKTNVTKAPKKGGLGGRTPLGDLSNSLKPSLNQKSKKQNVGIFSLAEKKTGASQIELDASKKKSTCNGSGKVQGGTRKPLSDISNSGKPLSDISNSGKPHVSDASKKSYNAKLSSVAEEELDYPSAIEEGFLHNHEECIKAQRRSLDLDEFLKIIGINTGLSRQSESCQMPVEEPESPPRLLEPEEMPEPLFEHKSGKYNLFGDIGSLSPCSTPTSPKASLDWDDMDYINFKLIDSP